MTHRWILLAALLGALTARAEDLEVLQVKQAFDPKTLTVAPGTAVVFVNADDVKHNLQLLAPDGTRTDEGLQKPGDTTRIVFPATGAYRVTCAIHPRMKLDVTVQP